MKQVFLLEILSDYSTTRISYS